MSRLRLATVIFVLACVPRLAEANTGVVIFDNGDRLTGEIKSLKRGLLRFKTDAAGTINIEWDNVAYLSSEQNIQVETEEGLRFLGHLSRSDEEYQVTVETEAGPFSIGAVRVVNMHPIKETISGRADGEVYAGYDFTKATEVKQFNAGFDLDYRTELRNFSLSGDATTSDSRGVDSSQRIDLLFDYTRFRRDRWINTVLLRANRNDQLGVDLRSSIGVGGGRILRQTNSTVFVLEGGLAYSAENVAGGGESVRTWESYGRVRWDWFRYDLPELDLSTQLLLIPSLSEHGRYRTDLDITFRWELIDDLFWRLNFYHSFDSQPSDPAASDSDYGINTTIAWTF